MTDLPKLIILDVAHGNCAILQDIEGTVVIDCAHGDTLIETLRNLHISYIDRIVISHADEDHIKGFIDLLSDESIIVRHIHINPDGSKKTRTWTNLRRLIEDAKKRNNTIRHFLYIDMPQSLDVGKVKLEVLAPSMDLVGQAGGLDLARKSLSSNSVSAVIRVVYESRGIALLAGDIDRVGLDNLLNDNFDINADILIFPHHGGNVGASREKDNRDFTTKLCQHVKPKLVLFSIGRDKHQNPRKEIVETLLLTLPDVHILCTQLAKHCSSDVLKIAPSHLNELPSKGREANHCCGGTVVINLNESPTTYSPNNTHRQFVQNNVNSPMCMPPNG